MESENIWNLGLSGIALLAVGAFAVAPAKSSNLPPISTEYQIACKQDDSGIMQELELQTYQTGYMLSCGDGVASIRELPSLQDMVGQSNGLPSAYRNQ